MNDLEPHFEPCRHCGNDGPHRVQVCVSGVHFAKVTCAACDRMLRWLGKPDGDKTKYKRPTKHTNLVAEYGRGFCEMCLRKQADFPKGQTLEAQHVVEFQDGGTNDRTNIWILCTPCHRLVHWLRYYHGGDYDQLLPGILKDPV